MKYLPKELEILNDKDGYRIVDPNLESNENGTLFLIQETGYIPLCMIEEIAIEIVKIYNSYRNKQIE